MRFYFPLRLGLTLRNAATRREERDGDTKPKAYEIWREGTERSLTSYEESPDAQVLKAISDSAPAQRLTFILGEPGAGKTTLFVDWFLRLACEAAKEVRLGAKLPILVRMRSVPPEIWNTNDEGKLADALWKHARTERTIFKPEDGTGHSPESIYNLDPREACAFSPIWLFDGLDEVAPSLSGDEHFYQKLACLPGQKSVSVRTAVYQSLRTIAEIYKWKDYEILGLRAIDQQAFLAQALRMRGDNDADAKSKKVVAEIRRNTAVHLLAGNPMMLGLMAELATGGAETLSLPASRAKFYAQSVNRLWHRKLIGDPDALRKREERDRFLTEQAAAMKLGTLRAKLPCLAEDLERGLRNSGLISVNDDGDGSFEFLHLTFQEYYLAQHLRAAELRVGLENHWSDARYEEALGLLVSLLVEEKRFHEVEDGIRWLVEFGIDAQRSDPNTLWTIGRSPTRTAVHILGRSAISLKTAELKGLLEFLWQTILGGQPGRRREMMRRAVALDSGMPPELLGRLAAGKDRDVREGVARNAGTRPEVLTRLGGDQHYEVRWGVAENPSTPPELLARLAGDQHPQVREGVAENPGTPLELLFLLARDNNRYVRIRVAKSPNTSRKLLAYLARDWDYYVRLEVVENASVPPKLLGRLAADKDPEVRAGVARNTSTPSELLVRLATDDEITVRKWVAWNKRTPPALLVRLAGDWKYVVYEVARNASTPSELLARLAKDEDREVRCSVARNAGTPSELLAHLAKDEDREVRCGAAGNASTPPELLARLAKDEDREVRLCVARHTRPLLEDLVLLDSHVRNHK
jgi:hypothetical protein